MNNNPGTRVSDDQFTALSRAANILEIPEAMWDPEAERFVKRSLVYQDFLLGLAIRRLGREIYAPINHLFAKCFTKETE